MKRRVTALIAFSVTFGICVAACKDPPPSGVASNDAAAPSSSGKITPSKKVDLAACDAGAQELERIAKSAKKTCQTSTDCTEWIRYGNCGSVAVAMPFPPTDSAAHFKELENSVAQSCPDSPTCKWASMGVECRAGVCAPSLEGRLDPTSAPAPSATP